MLNMYNNDSEALREALRIKMQQDEVYEAKLGALCAVVTAGLESGEPEAFDVNSILAEEKGCAGLDA